MTRSTVTIATALIDDVFTAICGVEDDPERLTLDMHRRVTELADEQLDRLSDSGACTREEFLDVADATRRILRARCA